MNSPCRGGVAKADLDVFDDLPRLRGSSGDGERRLDTAGGSIRSATAVCARGWVGSPGREERERRERGERERKRERETDRET